MASHPFATAASAVAVGVGASDAVAHASVIGPTLDPGIVAVVLGLIGLVPQIISLFKRKRKGE